jgi:hypothetical protein
VPKLPGAIAAALSARSDGVAHALAVGDPCRALAVARQLRRETIAAINARRVPGPFQEQLGSTVNDLVARIRCVAPSTGGHDNGKHDKTKSEKKGKHKHGGDD